MAGRPSDYTLETAERICDRISEGQSLRTICKDEDMPVKSTVFLWLSAHKEFSDRYARAREAQADALFEECLEIADDGTNDWMERRSEAEKGAGINTGWVLNGEHVQRSKLRVEQRRWAAARLAPKKYGDFERQELNVTGKVEVGIGELLKLLESRSHILQRSPPALESPDAR